MYEESLRIPLLMRWPDRVPAGSLSGHLVQNLDFAPTMLDFAGVEVPAEMQGRSLRPIALGSDPEDWRDAVYYRYWMNRAHFNVPAHLGIRTKRYKLIYFYDQDLGVRGAKPGKLEPFWELYDLDKDPREMQNVFADPAYAETAASLRAQLARLCDKYGDHDAVTRLIR